MRIPVLGMDPSLSNWGIAAAELCLETGILETPKLSLVSPKKLTGKQTRVTSNDIYRASQLALPVVEACKGANAIFVEVPIGSQSARAMASYGICVGILGSLRAQGITFIEVTPTQVKEAFTGDRNATKQQMIDQAVSLYPDANFPIHKGKVAGKAEHMADAIAAIHAGVNTPEFQTTMSILKGNPS